jgi:REP element-mobilizing transposase RayT
MAAPKRFRSDTRLLGYDYSAPGIYFITIVQKNWLPLFGEVNSNGVNLSPAGEMVIRVWQEMAFAFPWMVHDEYVLMPDHFHALVVLGSEPKIEARASLGTIVQRFKTISTYRYGTGVKESNWQPYIGKLWLQNYYERVVRNRSEYEKFQEYIKANPYRWIENRKQGILNDQHQPS